MEERGFLMDYMEQAEAYIADWCDRNLIDFGRISDTGTVENLMNDGWTPSEISSGKADPFISDNLDVLF